MSEKLTTANPKQREEMEMQKVNFLVTFYLTSMTSRSLYCFTLMVDELQIQTFHRKIILIVNQIKTCS